MSHFSVKLTGFVDRFKPVQTSINLLRKHIEFSCRDESDFLVRRACAYVCAKSRDDFQAHK